VDRLTLLRRLAWVTIGLGVLAGLAMDAPAPLPRLQSGGYTILAGDFHVHAFPGDGTLAPWALAREASRRGLDVIGLTNHNNMIAWRLSQLMPASGGAMVIPGEELTAVGYHMAAVGLTRTVQWRQPAAAAARAIQAAGGVAIAAHPVYGERRGLDREAIDAIDGFEAAHPAQHARPATARQMEEFRQLAFATRPSIAAIGSTDFHATAPLGLCRTFVFVSEVSPRGVVDAIRDGRTVACDGKGTTYGAPTLSSAVNEACARAAGSPGRDVNALGSIGAALVWLGCAALVAAGARERALE
jgi:hypothetical protein